MVKKLAPRKIILGGYFKSREDVGIAKTNVKLRKAFSKFASKSGNTSIKEDAKDRLKLAYRNLDNKKDTRDKQRERVVKQIEGKIGTALRGRTINRKVLRKGPRATLDLRRRPEREVPVEQHGFNEQDIAFSNVLNQ